MVLGSYARTSSAYGPVYTCRPVFATIGALEDELERALDRLPRDLFRPVATATAKDAAPPLRVGTAAEGATIKEGSYLVESGTLVQVIDGAAQPVAVRDGKGEEGIPAKHAHVIRGLIAIRDAVRDVLRAQANDEPWASAQVRLRSAYASFVRSFGPINFTTVSEGINAKGETRESFRRPNLQPFLDDPDAWLVASIEDYDMESGAAKHGPTSGSASCIPKRPRSSRRPRTRLPSRCTRRAVLISIGSPSFLAGRARPPSPNSARASSSIRRPASRRSATSG